MDRYLLYFQLHHRVASPWVPDFNGVSSAANPPWLDTFAAWDPLVTPVDRGAPDRGPDGPLPTPDLDGAAVAGVTQILVHRDELGARAEPLMDALRAGGAVESGREGMLVMFSIWATNTGGKLPEARSGRDGILAPLAAPRDFLKGRWVRSRPPRCSPRRTPTAADDWRRRRPRRGATRRCPGRPVSRV
jgi:hypothetical protein